ncbi:hypothetical protein GPS62_15410, partial [Acinetobacter haemolyticus]|nr:hypothetical protein [Acinetobacter haemolyticus]
SDLPRIASTRREPLSSGTVSRYFMRARKASGLSFRSPENCIYSSRTAFIRHSIKVFYARTKSIRSFLQI